MYDGGDFENDGNDDFGNSFSYPHQDHDVSCTNVARVHAKDGGAAQSLTPLSLKSAPAVASSIIDNANNNLQHHVDYMQSAIENFKMLDPHEVVSGSRAVKRGKTYRIPTASKQTIGSTSSSQLKTPPIDIFWDGIPDAGQIWANFDDKETASDSNPCKHSSGVRRVALFNPCLLPIYQAYKAISRREREALSRTKRAMRNGVRSSSNGISHGADAGNTEYEGFRYADEYVDDNNDDLPMMKDYDGGIRSANPQYDAADFGGINSKDFVPPAAADAADFEPIESGVDFNDFEEADDASPDSELARRLKKVLDDEMTSFSAVDKLSYSAILKNHMEHFALGSQQYAKLVDRAFCILLFCLKQQKCAVSWIYSRVLQCLTYEYSMYCIIFTDILLCLSLHCYFSPPSTERPSFHGEYPNGQID